MRKLLYLIPLVLLALNVTSLALYKDTVRYAPNGPLNVLVPSHWKIRDLNISASADLSQATVTTGNTVIPPTPPLSQGAKFYGFPAGFYLKNGGTVNTTYSSSTSSVTAWSWLWAVADGLFIVATLGIAIVFNRRRASKP